MEIPLAGAAEGGLTMSDSEKIKLISRMISDFWEFNEKEHMENGAVAMVTAIYTVVEMEASDGN